ncbi:hypothetical protein KIN20_024419 [Parelaphostrongylus tenuis]|uniref:Uncharacterized protein n=1 Tax=Parelaphostrongylus tenuis TaxID=148309 RepID=A0AAD5MY86_PARTN|nr:hypothetical protein KIN20_024419 [Parelaphostrongylus tenuis]
MPEKGPFWPTHAAVGVVATRAADAILLCVIALLTFIASERIASQFSLFQLISVAACGPRDPCGTPLLPLITGFTHLNGLSFRYHHRLIYKLVRYSFASNSDYCNGLG